MKTKTSIIRLTSFLVLVSASAHAQSTQPVSAFDRVAAKFASRAELKARVAQFRDSHSNEFATAKADFGLAVRSMISLDFPEARDRRGAIAPSPPQALPSFGNREHWVAQVARYRQGNEIGKATFYENHLDEISVEDCPAFRVVLLDVLLDGWDDWAAWDTQKLRDARNKWPDLHLNYALRPMCKIRNQQDYQDFKDVLPIAIQIIMDRTHSSATRRTAGTVAERIVTFGPDTDILTFSVERVSESPSELERELLVGLVRVMEYRLPPASYRSVWLERLESPDEFVRALAVDYLGDTIRKPRDGEAPRLEDAALAERLRQIAENDPSSRVKVRIQTTLRKYDTSDTRPTHGRLGDGQ
jgi:hypothetical protein